MASRFINDVSYSLHTEMNPNAIFVSTDYGGHMAFYEGSFLALNAISWIDRVVVDYTRAVHVLRNKIL